MVVTWIFHIVQPVFCVSIVLWMVSLPPSLTHFPHRQVYCAHLLCIRYSASKHLDCSSERHIPKSYLEFICFWTRTTLNNHLIIIAVLFCAAEEKRGLGLGLWEHVTGGPDLLWGVRSNGERGLCQIDRNLWRLWGPSLRVFERMTRMMVWLEQPKRDGPRLCRPLRSCNEVRLLRTTGSHCRVLSRGVKLELDF